MSVLKKAKYVFISLGALFASLLLSFNVLSTPVFAEPDNNNNQDTTQEENQNNQQNNQQNQEESTNTCYDESGSLGWLVCPSTGFLARITDGLYNIIESLLILKPLTTDSDSPYHQIWSIFRDITNVIFVIFFLVVIYSQVTGIGISNYGIKKLLPKIILSAILINLSYIICAALVDVSNVVGSSLKGIFANVEESITATGIITSLGEGTSIDFSSILAGLTGGALLAGLAISASGGLGALFISLIPVLLGAVVAVVVAYLTIAMRQALVYLLIMVSPLAFVCQLLPNTEGWFTKWKKALSQMLFFYPSFAALFGASSLIGWTIIAAAEDGFALVLGIAVKVVPLFASWSLLKMSGTLPGQIGAAINKYAQRPVGAVRSWSNDEAAYRRARYLGSQPRTWQYGRKFGQSMQDHKVRRLSDTQKYLEISKLRSSAYASQIRDPVTGKVTKRGRQLTALTGQGLNYQRIIMKNANDAEKGLANYASNKADKERLTAIDVGNMEASDELYYETARGEKVRFDNTQSRQDRINAALNANSNAAFNATRRAQELARTVNAADLERYKRISTALEGDVLGTHLVGANAASDLGNQTAVMGKKFSTYFQSIPPTQELYDRLFQLTGTDHISKDIDPIIAGLTALNMRGDTDLVTNVVERMLETQQIRLGTHASQSLANFCMFTAKDTDVFLRRFGKYINLETARVYNEGQSKPKRKNDILTMNEYITGSYDEYDADGNLVPGDGKSKLSLAQLVEGTSLDGVERTYFDNMATRIRNAYVHRNGDNPPDPDELAAFKAKMTDIENAMAPAFISAMLKYPSGSEPMVNGAADLTGYKRKGKSYIPRWEDPDDPYYGVGLEFFAKRVRNYLGWQTPQQILSLRTDVFYPIIENLADDYARRIKAHEEDPENNPDPADEIAPELKKIVDVPESDVPEWFTPKEIGRDDSPEEKARKKAWNDAHAEERTALRKKFAKIAFMDLLFKNNTLDQIMTSRRSGAANAAKRAVRDFLGLDSDDFVEDYRDDSNERKKKHRIERQRRREHPEEFPEEETTEAHSETGESDFPPIYDADGREFLRETFRQMFNDDPESEDFYAEAFDELVARGLDLASEKLRDYYERNPHISNRDLLEFILGLLDDDENF